MNSRFFILPDINSKFCTVATFVTADWQARSDLKRICRHVFLFPY